MKLNVNLGPEFPLEKPVLKIKPLVNHPWIEHLNEISLAPGLLNFTVHSDLGRVVQAVIREFELRPPPLCDNSTQQSNQQGNKCDESTSDSTCSMVPSNNYQYLVTTSTAGNFNYSSRNLTPSSPHSMSIMFPELNSLAISELKELNENWDKLDDLVDSLPTKQNLNKNMDDWIDTVDKLAKENLKLEPELMKLQTEVKEKLEVLNQAKENYEKYNMEYQQLCEMFSPCSIRERLRQSVALVDEESERIAERFLIGDIDLETFLTEYIGHRMVSYSRKAKDEKLSQQLEKLQQAGF